MKYKPFEIIIGTAVIAAAVYIVVSFYDETGINLNNMQGYKISAEFNDIADLAKGSDVKISGVNVGKVKNITLNNKYMVNIEMIIDRAILIPEDSMAILKSSSLMGPIILEIVPGVSESYLSENSILENTHVSVLDINAIAEKFMMSKVEKK